MINKIVNSVTTVLSDKFDIPVYVNHVEQDLKLPSFYVKVVDVNLKPFLKNRCNLTVQLAIHYFPKTEVMQHQVSFELFDLLRFMPLHNGGQINGFNINSTIQDNVLITLVDYSVILNNHNDDLPKLEELEINGVNIDLEKFVNEN